MRPHRQGWVEGEEEPSPRLCPRARVLLVVRFTTSTGITAAFYHCCVLHAFSSLVGSIATSASASVPGRRVLLVVAMPDGGSKAGWQVSAVSIYQAVLSGLKLGSPFTLLLV